jgi:glycosyltransferase involved in cell wall biosynthesis
MDKVTVVVLTYNLKQYIGECLDSIIAQKTNFTYKIVIADDMSTDGTRDILIEYKNKHPDMIELILADKNCGSLTNNNKALENVKTEYFTLIDGDDYWINENRLQEQVDFLDSHKDYTICAGNTFYLKNGKRSDKIIPKKYLDKGYSYSDLCSFNMPFVHTSALLTRNVIYSKGVPNEYYDVIGTYEECAVRGEYIRLLQHIQQGKLWVANKDYSVYRVHKDGAWQGKSNLSNMLESAISFQYYRKHIDDKGTGFFERCLVDTYRELMESLEKDYKLKEKYELTDKDNKRYIALLCELQEHPIDWRKYPYTRKRKSVANALKNIVKRCLHR